MIRWKGDDSLTRVTGEGRAPAPLGRYNAKYPEGFPKKRHVVLDASTSVGFESTLLFVTTDL